MKIKTRFILLATFGFLGAIVLGQSAWGFFWSDKKDDTIKIAVVSPYSGDLASYGIPSKNAAKLAVNALNANGGILGKKIKLFEEDDVCEANTAANVANKLVSEKVFGVVGHLCSGATKAALPIYQSANIIVISPASTNPDLTLTGKNKNFFRTIAHDAAQANLQVDFIVKKLKSKKVAVIHDKADYGKGLADLVKEGLEKAGVNVVLYEGITAGAVDYSALINKTKKAAPETVVFGGYHPEASKIVGQARSKGITANFVSGDGVKDPSFLKIAGKSAEGYYTSAPTDVSQFPMAKSVSDQYKKTYQSDPGTFSLQSYAAIQALANAIRVAGEADYQKTVDALKTQTVDTPLGKISFDENGDVIGAGFAMYQVVNGTFQRAK